ncbi:MAG TPA: hypothetical protein VGG33_15300, partial [Polyangia bacterium]
MLASTGVVAVALVLTDLLLGGALQRDLLARMEADVEVRLALVEARLSATSPPISDVSAWDAIADESGRASGVRVTFVAPDGRVLGDSEVPSQSLSQVENHAGREEVAAALATGRGTARRRSSTVERWMLYKAARSQATGVVVRLALPLTELEEARKR